MADAVVADPSPDRVRPSRLRGFAATVLVVLTALAVLVASLAVWADRTVLDRGRFSATVARVAQDGDVVDAATSFLTDELFSALGPTPTAGASVSNVVAPLLADAARPRVEDGIRTVLQAPATRRVIEVAVGEAHTVALRLVRSGGSLDVANGGVTVDDGVVRLNLLPLVDDVLLTVQAAGVLPAGITLPDLAPGGAAEAQVQQLAASLGVTLPPDFAQVTVYSSQDLADAGTTLAQANDALRLFQRAVIGIVVVAAALAALALVVSARRWRTLAQLGVATAVAMVVSTVARRPSPVGRWARSWCARSRTVGPRWWCRPRSTPSGPVCAP